MVPSAPGFKARTTPPACLPAQKVTPLQAPRLVSPWLWDASPAFDAWSSMTDNLTLQVSCSRPRHSPGTAAGRQGSCDPEAQRSDAHRAQPQAASEEEPLGQREQRPLGTAAPGQPDIPRVGHTHRVERETQVRTWCPEDTQQGGEGNRISYGGIRAQGHAASR